MSFDIPSFTDERASRYRAESYQQTPEQKAAINNHGVRPLPFFGTADLYGEYKPSPSIMKQVLDPGDWLTFFGDSGALKTFLVIDMMMHVGLGLDYCGHRVRRTGVLMVAGEGTEGIRKRVKAWLIRHGVTADDDQPHLVVTSRPASLMDDPHTVADTIAAAERAIGVPIGVVVVDTLSSNFGPGNENDTADMRTVMSNTRMVIGERAVIAVHHVGHSEKGRERGSYALRGDADRRIKVELGVGGDSIIATCEKAKDDLPFAPMAFKWRVVELGWRDIDGDMLTSIVLEPTDYRAGENAGEPDGDIQKAVMRTLRAHGAGMRRADLPKALPKYNHSNVYRAIRVLIDAEVLVNVAGVIGIRGNEKP